MTGIWNTLTEKTKSAASAVANTAITVAKKGYDETMCATQTNTTFAWVYNQETEQLRRFLQDCRKIHKEKGCNPISQKKIKGNMKNVTICDAVQDYINLREGQNNMERKYLKEVRKQSSQEAAAKAKKFMEDRAKRIQLKEEEEKKEETQKYEQRLRKATVLYNEITKRINIEKLGKLIFKEISMEVFRQVQKNGDKCRKTSFDKIADNCTPDFRDSKTYFYKIYKFEEGSERKEAGTQNPLMEVFSKHKNDLSELAQTKLHAIGAQEAADVLDLKMTELEEKLNQLKFDDLKEQVGRMWGGPTIKKHADAIASLLKMTSFEDELSIVKDIQTLYGLKELKTHVNSSEIARATAITTKKNDNVNMGNLFGAIRSGKVLKPVNTPTTNPTSSEQGGNREDLLGGTRAGKKFLTQVNTTKTGPTSNEQEGNRGNLLGAIRAGKNLKRVNATTTGPTSSEQEGNRGKLLGAIRAGKISKQVNTNSSSGSGPPSNTQYNDDDYA
jgi:hypothetical protein